MKDCVDVSLGSEDAVVDLGTYYYYQSWKEKTLVLLLFGPLVQTCQGCLKASQDS